MKNFLLVWLSLIITLKICAQQKTSVASRISLNGIVADSNTSLRISGATVEISIRQAESSANTQGLFRKKTVITNASGKFEIDRIPFTAELYVVVSAVGYKQAMKIVAVPLNIKNSMSITVSAGVIKLVKEYKALDAVVISSRSKSMLEFQNDKRVFHADKAIVSQGGTAIDLMKTIPSLSVDADGNVTMRNSSPQILVDGRPSLLTLEQIPADMIEKVELITNPSARFDASSSAGIINIILKKSKVAGINGIASIGAGVPGLFNSNMNVNFRQKKFNLFAGGNYNQSGGKIKEQSYRENKSNGLITDYFAQQSQSGRARNNFSLRGGIDYYISKKSTVSFVHNMSKGKNSANEKQVQEYYDDEKLLLYSGLRVTDRMGDYRRNSSRLSFEQKFRNDEKLTADITFNSSNGKNGSAYGNNFFLPDGENYMDENRVRSSGNDRGNQFIGQIDYSRKWNDDKRIEAGLRIFHNKSRSEFNSFQVNSAQSEIKLPLSNNYSYTENVNAAYFNYAGKWKSFSYQAGLRFELSDFNGLLIDSNAHFGYHFPEGLKHLGYAIFPSFFISKSFTENSDFQLSYSKRIRRPGFWQVNPYIDINDPMNIRLGNPQLKPEYTNSIEFNFFNRFKKEGSLLAALYFKNNVGDITLFSDTLSTALYQQLSEASISPDAILNSYINAGYTNRAGLEVIIEKKIFNNLDLSYSNELQYRVTKASTEKLILNNSGLNFETRLTGAYKFPAAPGNFFNAINLQLTAGYESPRIIPQGKIKGRFVSDFAVRKEFLKKRAASIVVSVNDLFNSQKFGTIYNTDKFYQDSYRRWNVRTFRVTFAYRFGNSKIDLFNKKKRPLRDTEEQKGEDFSNR
jgi:outer membrane receptor protein involved in Fe transport